MVPPGTAAGAGALPDASHSGRRFRNQFAKETAVALIIRNAGAVLALVVSVALARTLGTAGFGVYSYVLAVIALLALPAEFGIVPVLIRFCAEYDREKSWGQFRGLLEWANRNVLIVSGVLVAGAAAVFALFPGIMPDPGRTTITMWWGLALLPIFALGEIRGAALRGLRLFVKGQAPEVLLRPGSLLLLLGLFWLLPGERTLQPAVAMVMYLIASVVAFAVGAYWLWHAIPAPVKTASAVTDHVVWRKMATSFSISRGGRVVLSKIDLVIVGVLLGSEETGVFRVASALAMIVAFGLSAVNTVATPYFSRIGHQQRSDLRHMLWFSSLLSTALAVPLMALLVFFGGDVIALLYGKEFVAGYAPLLILAAGQLVNAVTGPAGSLLAMTGHERWVLISVWIALGITLPAYFAVVPTYGMAGAAWVTTGGVCILNALMWTRAWGATRHVPMAEAGGEPPESASL